MATRTLAQLRSDVRSRADQVNDEFCSDDEINRFINSAGAALHRLITSVQEDYYLTNTTVTVSSGSTISISSSLPTMHKLRKVEYQISGSTGDWVKLNRVPLERADLYSRSAIVRGSRRRGYFTTKTTIQLLPESNATGTYRIWYLEGWTDMASDGATVTDEQGWSEYIVIAAAIKAKDKEESDVSVLMAELAAIEVDIRNSAQNRDAGEQMAIIDVRGRNSDDDMMDIDLDGW